MKKIAIIFCAGSLILCVGGCLFYRWRKNKKGNSSDEPLEVEYISYKKYNDAAKEQINNVEAVVRDYDDKVKKWNDIHKEKFAKQVNDYMKTDGEKINFEEYLAEMECPEEDDSDDSEDDEDDDISDERGHHSGPYEITAGEFCNNRTYYDKVSVNYFGEDEVVADDRDEVMGNAFKVLGDIRTAFNAPRKPNVIYIRNEDLEVDYEVSYVDGSYQRDVLHIEKEE